MAVFNGTSGDDSFVAPTGTNTINGFGGIDTISFNFSLVGAAPGSFAGARASGRPLHG